MAQRSDRCWPFLPVNEGLNGAEPDFRFVLESNRSECTCWTGLYGCLWPKAAVQNVGVETERRAVADEAFGKMAIKIGFQRFTSVVPFQNGPSVLSRLIDFVLGIVVHVLLFIVAARPIPVDKAIEYPLRYGGIFSRNRGD